MSQPEWGGRAVGEKGSRDPLTPGDQWPSPREGLNKGWKNQVVHGENYCWNRDGVFPTEVLLSTLSMPLAARNNWE